MKKANKINGTSKPIGYTENVDIVAGAIVSEPAMMYANIQDALLVRAIGLMGMNAKRDYPAIKNDTDFIGVIREGIPKLAMSYLMTNTDISLIEMAAITHTSDRTLRRYKPDDKLPQEQSERMVELAKLYSRGELIFGGLAQFKQWMDTCLVPLGNKKPKEFLDTSLGINLLMEELGRIENGVFA